jgi:hypothetical protein
MATKANVKKVAPKAAKKTTTSAAKAKPKGK